MRSIIISPIFFQYHNLILEELEKKGHQCKLISDRLFTSNIFKALTRINNKTISALSAPFYKRLFMSIKDFDPDYVLIINGEGLSYGTIKFIRNLYPYAKLIFYTWDSLANKKDTLKSRKLFDNFWSFDKRDCDTHSINFLPLFYQEQSPSDVINQPSLYDLAFIGTIHSNRLRLINDISKIIPSNKFYKYLYLQSKVIYLKNKLLNIDYKDHSIKDFSFKSLPLSKINQLHLSSKAILDINHPFQSGLTMRTFEALGINKKLITTNQNVVNYDFYNSNNVLVYHENINPNEIKEFLEKPFESISENIIKKYTLSNWLNIILNK